MFRSNPAFLPSPNRKTLAAVIIVSFFCAVFYSLGIYLNSPSPIPRSDTVSNCTQSSSSGEQPLDFDTHHSAAATISLQTPILPRIEFCDQNFIDYCPCQDPRRERRFHTENLLHRERHCPELDEKPTCRIPKPSNYRAPIRWPESRDRIWFGNVPSTRLTVSKKEQNWVRVEGDRLFFPGGGTSFPDGVKPYVSSMAKLVPLKSGEIRTALDIGCGVATFGGRLLDFNIVTLSVAPRDVHEAQVQFALERGIPAMLGVLSTYRLPYPSRAFDMAHCARCLVPWTAHEGIYLAEMDRVLRPGGYWVLSGPPINWKSMYKGWKRTVEDLKAEQEAIEEMAKRLCWKKVAEKGGIAVWRKPMNHVACEKSLRSGSLPFCGGRDPDAAWYEKMESCITPLPRAQDPDEVSGGSIKLWPERLHTSPPRITNHKSEQITAVEFNQDTIYWEKSISHYSIHVNLKSKRFRNVMDMNAGLGGFAAALSKLPVWVMNVVPFNSENNTLGVIFERGLIGTFMDWCEAFSTYPRTYDLIHASGLLSMYNGRCEMMDIMLEMDRILRPGGVVILRDNSDVVAEAKKVADQLQWQSRIIHTEYGSSHNENILLVDNSLLSDWNRAPFQN